MCYVRSADQNTQIQLFNLASGSPVLVGSMTDDGQNGDQTANDKIYTIVTSITAPAASSLPMQVTATSSIGGSTSTNFSAQVVQIPTYTADADVNQAESQLYDTATQTRTSFSNPDWSKLSFLQGIGTNLMSMFGEINGVVAQNSTLQTENKQIIRKAAETSIQGQEAHPEGIVQDILDVFTSGLLSPAQNATSCNQLVESLGGFRSSYSNALSSDDPQLLQFALELSNICSTASNCQGAFDTDDFLGSDAYATAAAEWAHEYIVSGQALPTSIAGCGGGVTKSLANVAVKSELSQFTDLASEGLSDLTDAGEISQQIIGQVNDTLVGWFVDNSGNSKVAIGQVASSETFTAPFGTYHLAVSFGGSAKNATVSKTPVYPKSTTNISPSAGAAITVTPPYVKDLNPGSGVVGATITIAGTGFDTNASGNEVSFNGISAQVTSSTSATIQAVVPLGASTGPVSVATSSGSTTSSVYFTVTGSTGNPMPAITALFPNTVVAGKTSQLLTINGTGFVSTSTVTFNGVAHAANFIGTNRFTISLAALDLATAGTYPIVVINSTPGGGSSTAANFTVTSTVTEGAGDWTWVSGASKAGQVGVFGTQGVPAATNFPGERENAASWTDANGNLWLFGGWGLDSVSNFGALNDLWEFNPTTRMWTWKSGSSTVPNSGYGQPGVYGTQGVPAATNVPGGRVRPVSWTDSNGNLWLFGGMNAFSNMLNDLWEFNPATRMWTWISGSSADSQPGV